MPGLQDNSEQLVELVEAESSLPFVLLQPGSYPPRQGRSHQRVATWRDLPHILPSIYESEFCAVDFETKGGDFSADIQIVGIGLAWDSGSCYFQWSDLSLTNRNHIVELLATHKGLVAHNVYFDGGVIRKLHPAIKPTWYACTYALYAMLANESPERRWGLKDAQVDLLGWESSNEGELDEWLVSNGFYRGNRLKDESPAHLLEQHRNRKLNPDKGEMWRAPTAILGKYCILDAESTYLLFTEVLNPILRRFPDFDAFFRGDWMHLIDQLIEQKIYGIPVDRGGLIARREVLQTQIDELANQFVSDPTIAPHILQMRVAQRDAALADLQKKEPPKLKKNGDVSKNWINWVDRCEKASDLDNPEYSFNLQSGPQLRELLYERIGLPIRITSESGLPGVGADALQQMGETGGILCKRLALSKELSYIEKYIELTEHRDTIHPSFRAPGTITGRLSSKEPNLQQVPKSKAVMSLFRARPGHVWVDLDFAALESVVAAELSQDPNLVELYGDGKPENDVHLFVGAQVPSELGRRILATGYQPSNPPPGSVSKAKKECKAERNLMKAVVYGCQFGMGIDLLETNLQADGIQVTRQQVEDMHGAYWSTFARLKQYGYELQKQWRRNAGYVLNGLGRPMAVAEDYRKDCLSRVIQSTGHDLLVKYIRILCDELTRREIRYRPLIIDWHDASAVEVPAEFQQQTIDTYMWAMAELNRLVGGSIQLKGTPSWGTTLACIKEPEE